ncbi:MAG: class I SAM-dependent methyltransferase [Planctomycetota bacterium]|nr:class I SAM-dependent methyltransferase [Planctomycetota bacterium]MCZ6611593.1 class I SAM-dependent methyltransferase [Planctomycetota bacterium]MCZ6734853.1 class I SAM-dependent methyltransferase [Planctomycetota bacterium]MCZ6811898.1 class I SAM-dependent methyltransferase [Planctomycetota bacterium]MCZ6850464.1 class I SAM-dependent methyltransferase [Planctomycetota bacterium]
MTDLYGQAELYCAAFSWPVADEIDWLLSLVPGATSVLEPFCGNARYGSGFAERGLEYHGLDLSPAMLQRAKLRPGMTLHQADARDFTIRDIEFDLAWCPINSVRHLLSEEELVGHLRSVGQHLSSRGVYVVETSLDRRDGPVAEKPSSKARWTQTQPDGSAVTCTWWAVRYDLAARRVWERAHIQRHIGNELVQEISHVYEQRMLTDVDWRKLVADGGFTVSRTFVHKRDECPAVTATAEFENTGRNMYFFLEPA